MNRIIMVLIVIIIIIIAIVTNIYTINKNEKNNIEINNVAVKNSVNEETTNEDTKTIVEANSEEERISPNGFITFKKTYQKCGHTTSEFLETPQEFVNLNEEELKEKYKDWKIEKFTDTDIILSKEIDGNCNQHYILRDIEGVVKVFHILEDGTEEEYMITDIATEYLTDTDKINMENGIKVNGKQNLNQLIEDFE